MRYLRAFLVLALILGCRKSAPTSFIRAFSITGDDGSYHSFTIHAVSPNFEPDVRINGEKIEVEDGWGGYFEGWDTLPSIFPNSEVQLEVRYKDLNEKEKKATSKVKIPYKPSVDLRIGYNEVSVYWNKPDEKKVSFVYVNINCNYEEFDTIITDLEVTNVKMRCYNPYYVGAFVAHYYGPWSGSKDNIKGIKGQYYGGAYGYKYEYASPTAKLHEKFKPDMKAIFRRMIDKINRKFSFPDEGSWINGF